MKSSLAVLIVTTLAVDGVLWRVIWECTLVKNRSAVLNVITLVPDQVLWKSIWEFILVRSLSVVLGVITPFLDQIIWRDIWHCTPVKSLRAVLSVTSLFSIKSFDETYENSYWTKALQLYSCAQSINFKVHMISVHTGEKPYSCTQCDYSCV